jgi:hypothetical protein
MLHSMSDFYEKEHWIIVCSTFLRNNCVNEKFKVINLMNLWSILKMFMVEKLKILGYDQYFPKDVNYISFSIQILGKHK